MTFCSLSKSNRENPQRRTLRMSGPPTLRTQAIDNGDEQTPRSTQMNEAASIPRLRRAQSFSFCSSPGRSARDN